MSTPEENTLLPEAEQTTPPMLDLALGIVFSIGGAALFAASAQFQAMVPGTPIGPGLMPRVCALAFMGGGVALAISAIRNLRAGKTADEVETGALGYSAIVLLGLLAVAYLAQYLGFVITAAAYSLAVMRAGGARWIAALLAALVTTGLVYALFSSFMRVPLPRAGLIPGWPF